MDGHVNDLDTLFTQCPYCGEEHDIDVECSRLGDYRRAGVLGRPSR